jgi:hypothetical protein
MQYDKIVDEIELRGKNVIAKVSELLREGNITRIIVKDKSGSRFVEIPVTLGVIGLLVTPVLMLLGFLLAFATEFRIVIERVQPQNGNRKSAVLTKS